LLLLCSGTNCRAAAYDGYENHYGSAEDFLFIQGLILIFILVHDILISGVIFTKSEYIAMRFL